ncbi:class I SAM-dependent methyltransferase [Flavobacteriaceae bacterium]|jgi:SAM-dependent methyltransferase|nr:class I SAM-dependent methyltransferase [Bacteroidota bacterium]MDB2471542.1 class I SAM-dependent methyltransferase [Flavobacteriaceae bacterium]MDC0957372.1 class I SAM-dependent methyltransferase [Flavobacteriaceae bacterium]MDC1051754.1 class I SAM-dependent methyltransferase [Flavobacteriaceae bacterium]MDC3242173.1 class I SAM-dependent methyltransferase [Flavobacteriaceae bacterium]|tara:strand:+ start:982 stop:1713 length:732 start_codon:yes stop_codon:yes gene_type:complete
MTKDMKHWYSSWFDTPFYHILYKDRDDKEAQSFMDALTYYLNISQNSTILDLACGKGRHSLYLNSIGYDVTGLDLSKQSISEAKQKENGRLCFDVHDMSKPYFKQFDTVFNLFTSFGYFDCDEDNLNTIKAIKANLKPNGIGVIDFMNIDVVKNSLKQDDIKTVNGIDFYLKRSVKNGYIVKDIAFNFKGQDFNFYERVKAFSLNDFKTMFEQAELTLLDVFGDYQLNTFNKQNSERLIMIFM